MNFYTHTAVVHAVESKGVLLTEVKVLPNDVVELWDFGGDSGDGIILIEGEWPVMHDGLIVVCCVLISDEVITVFVKVVFKSCRKDALHVISLFKSSNLTTLNLTAGLVRINVFFMENNMLIYIPGVT